MRANHVYLEKTSLSKAILGIFFEIILLEVEGNAHFIIGLQLGQIDRCVVSRLHKPLNDLE